MKLIAETKNKIDIKFQYLWFKRDWVDDSYEVQEIEQIPDHACFNASFDGKGIPKIKARNLDASQRFIRLGKDQKRGIKQMATASVMSWFEPRKRNKASIIRGLIAGLIINKMLKMTI